MRKGTCLGLWIITLPVLMGLVVTQAMAQTRDGKVPASSLSPSTPTIVTSTFTNPFQQQSVDQVCGNLTQQGTPIAGNAAGGGTSGAIDISGIPATATVKRATLYWTVLTNTNPSSSLTGGSITFNNNMGSGDVGVTGTVMAYANTTACFTQLYTIAWKADVTSLVLNPGNGTYSVAGFPGGNALTGSNFTEGATLQILWTEPNAPLRDVVVYETGSPLAVSNGPGQSLTQNIAGFTASSSGPASGTLYEVIGNGQADATENLSVTGPGGTVNLNNTLDGSTSEFAAGSCSYTDVSTNQCFWDDDTPDISGALNNGATSVTMYYQMAGAFQDCHDFSGVAVSISTDDAAVCQAGIDYVDTACPPAASYRNHGDYLSCVAHAAEQFLGETGCSTLTDQYTELKSCIVNPHARSSVGKN